MKRVFITGSTGLLGSTILREHPNGLLLGASYYRNLLVPSGNIQYFNLDITDSKNCTKILSVFKPDIVIHTAAIATPDYCDKHQDKASAVNIDGTRNLIEASKSIQAKFIYITTNGVYDGEKYPYNEKSEIKPIDWYGHTKFEAEKLTQLSELEYSIVRLITMYGWNNSKERQNPLTWLLEILGTNKNPVNLVTDMFNNFLSVHEASRAIWKVALGEYPSEIFNRTAKTTEYQSGINGQRKTTVDG